MIDGGLRYNLPIELLSKHVGSERYIRLKHQETIAIANEDG